MVDILYAGMDFVCIVVISLLLNRTVVQKINTKIRSIYLQLLVVMLVFSCVDFLWGVFASKEIPQGTWVLYIFSYLFHISCAICAFSWLRFTVMYFYYEDSKKRNLLKSVSLGLTVAQCAVVISNLFNPVVFYITNDFIYHSGRLRVMLFAMQGVSYVSMFLLSLVIYCRNETRNIRNRAGTAIAFSLAPLLTALVQFMLPDGPVYAAGFMIGCITIYIFTFAEEREALLVATKQMEIEKENDKSKLVDYEIIKRVAGDVDYICIIDKNQTIWNYQIGGLFSKLISADRETLTYYEIDEIFKKIMPEDDYKVFVPKAAMDVVFNRLKTEDGYHLMSNVFYEDEEYQYRMSFYRHPNDINSVIFCCRNYSDQLKEIKEKEEALLKASTDGLTGLLNKSSFEDKATSYIKKHGSYGIGFIFLDLDHFKEVNDELGHAEGDKVLQDTAERIKHVVRKDDLVSRQGGDEFCIFIPKITQNRLEEKACSLHDTLKDTRVKDGKEVTITASIGCVFSTDDRIEYASLRAKADETMYNVKKNGRDGYQVMVF